MVNLAFDDNSKKTTYTFTPRNFIIPADFTNNRRIVYSRARARPSRAAADLYC